MATPREKMDQEIGTRNRDWLLMRNSCASCWA